MENIFSLSVKKVKLQSMDFVRYLYSKIDWNNQLILIMGARGVGKTTILIQKLKEHKKNRGEEIYISLDNLYFSSNTLYNFANNFVSSGGKRIFIDEIHKYPKWSQELKNIYDDFPELKIVATGSSAIEIYKSQGDLSRRALVYNMYGMSFREFLKYEINQEFPKFSLDEILSDHIEITSEISSKIKPLKYFSKYLQKGYYPFYKKDEDNYNVRLASTVNLIMENDIPGVFNVDYSAVLKMKKFLAIISQTPPFKPNITKLSRQVGLSRDAILKYMSFMHKAGVIDLLYSSTKGISAMNKPEKLFLQNSNLYWSLTYGNINIGSLRETFVKSQFLGLHNSSYPEFGDLLIDDKYTFEIGGKSKTQKQIKDIDNSFILSDNIEIGYLNKIPLWLIGFMY